MKQGILVKRSHFFFGTLITISLLLPAPAWSARFSIAILPDTQFYPETNPDIFYAQTEWIKNNWKEKNIIYAAHLGDIIDSDCNADATEWGVADTAMKTLDDEGIPYGILPGNHDYDPGPSLIPCSATTNNYNNGYPAAVPPVTGFGPARFSSKSFYGGSYESELATPPPNPTNDDNYTLFEFCGNKFIAINFAYTTESAAPSSDILDWADNLLATNLDRKAIITTHFMLEENTPFTTDPGGQTVFGAPGAAIYNRLAARPNLFLMLGAHRRGEAWRIEQRTGMDDVHILLSDYQDYAYSASPNYSNVGQNTCPLPVGGPGCGDSGFMQIMEFDTDTDQVSVQTFIPRERILLADPTYTGGDLVSTRTESDGSPITDGSTMSRFTASSFTFPYNSDSISPSVALLLDTSGSMSWAVDGDRPVPEAEQRITLVKESARAFLELMRDSGADAIGARFGIATFPDHPSSSCSSPSGEVVTTFRSANSTNIDAVIDPSGTIDTDLPTENSTPLLSGVDTVNGMFTDAEQCRTVVLLSDGYHNCGPGAESDVDTRIANLNSNDIRLFTIGFGEPGDTDNLLYQDLANGTKPDHISSQFYDVTADLGYNPAVPSTWETIAKPALDGVFKEILSTALGLETAADPIGVINPGATEPETFDVAINEHDRRVAFYLSWSTLQTGLLSLTVKDSSGSPVSLTDAGVSRADGKTYSILTVDQEFLSRPGRVTATPWRIEVGKSEFLSAAETFQYSVVMGSGLKLHPQMDRNDYAAGDTITLTASLTETGRPITGLSDVEVLVSAPEDGKGNWLSNNEVSARQLDRVPVMKGNEPLAPFQRKGIYLTDFGDVAYPGRLGVRTVRLYDDGSHGDVTANDGVYSNRFSETGKEGVYSFYFRSHGGTRGGNHFTREQLVQTYLKVRAVPEAIAVDVASLDTGDLNRFSIQATPRDALGNYLGPGHGGRIGFSASGGTFVGTLQDNLDGSYSQILDVPPGTAIGDVQVNVRVDDVNKEVNLVNQYAFSFHLGQTSPSGSFGKLYDSDIHLGLDLERALDSRLSAIGELQYNRFEAAQSGLSDTYWVSLTGGLKYTLSPGAWQPYVAGSIGVYSPRSGSSEPGLHIGLGVSRKINPRWSVEIGAGYHNIFTSGSDVEFSVFRAGLVFRP